MERTAVKRDRRGRSSVRFGLTATHAERPVDDVVALLGPADLGVSRGERHSDGSVVRESIWISSRIELETSALAVSLMEWLVGNAIAIRRLIAEGWHLTLGIVVIAVDPITSLALGTDLLPALSDFDGLAVEIDVLPKPRILDESAP
jgi:hypothetical protein